MLSPHQSPLRSLLLAKTAQNLLWLLKARVRQRPGQNRPSQASLTKKTNAATYTSYERTNRWPPYTYRYIHVRLN
jgi:hypothetical protein